MIKLNEETTTKLIEFLLEQTFKDNLRPVGQGVNTIRKKVKDTDEALKNFGSGGQRNINQQKAAADKKVKKLNQIRADKAARIPKTDPASDDMLRQYDQGTRQELIARQNREGDRVAKIRADAEAFKNNNKQKSSIYAATIERLKNIDPQSAKKVAIAAAIIGLLTTSGLLLYRKYYRNIKTNCESLPANQKRKCKSDAKLRAARLSANKKGSRKK